MLSFNSRRRRRLFCAILWRASSFRVPIARLAAAQAAIKEKRMKRKNRKK